jgi:hypothetical protein
VVSVGDPLGDRDGGVAVVPPAPYVIDTKSGRSGSSSRIACQSSCSPSASWAARTRTRTWRRTPDQLTDRGTAGSREGSPRDTHRLYRPAGPS